MRPTYRFALVLGVLCLALPIAQIVGQPVARVTVRGQVLDAETGQPLADANVFVANTLLGSATDSTGTFAVHGIPLGSHTLVVAFLGYHSHTESLRLTDTSEQTFTFYLQPRVLQQEGIEVTALSEKQWKRYFKTFRKFFLGTSRNASRCTILNPEVLDFSVNEATNQLTATAREPLQIENRALGYLIHFVLDEFQLREQQRYIKFRGTVGFNELTPGSERERRRWEQRRQEAYNGSMRHFLTSLVRDELWEEGFMLLSEEESQQAAYSGVPGSRPSQRVSGVGPEEILAPGEMTFERRVTFSGYLKVIYYNEMPNAGYLRVQDYANRGMRGSQDEQVSWIALNGPGATITTDGQVADTYALTKFGYWYFERVAEMLPQEYLPPGMVRIEDPGLQATVSVAELHETFVEGVEAVREQRYTEAIENLSYVFSADPGFFEEQRGSVAYWLGTAYTTLERTASAHDAWLKGMETLQERGKFDVAMADAYVQSVFKHKTIEAFEPATWAYLDLLDLVDADLPQQEREIVNRHVAQMLPLFGDDERKEILRRDPGPMLQRLRFRSDTGAYLSTWWRRQDPLPGSALNERVAEHLTRVMHAMENYAFSRTPMGFDDRGKAYVRYGQPQTRTSIPIDISGATQVLRENAYSMPGPLISPMNEFWAYQDIDEVVYYVFVLEGGRYQAGSPEDLVPRDLRSAYKRRGKGHSNPRTPDSPDGTQTPANQVMAEALVEVWTSIYTELSHLHSAFEDQISELEMNQNDVRATKVGGAAFSATALSYVNSVDLKFDAMARQAILQRETEAPRVYSQIPGAINTFPVEARMARFLDDDGSTRTELFWSHYPGSLALSKRIRNRIRTEGRLIPDRYLLQLVVSLHSEDYRQRVPTQLTYLASDLDEGTVAPVQVLDVRGSTTPYHLSMQWDQFLIEDGETEGNVVQGPHLQTSIETIEALAPLNSDPKVLEMSDLKPVYLDEDATLISAPDDQNAPDDTPYPFASLSSETPLGLYFEVYHLTFGTNDQTHYTIEYEVVVDPEGRRRKQTTAQTSYTGRSRKAEEFIGLDLSAVAQSGPIEVVIRVRDDESGKTVERTIPFTLQRTR